MKASFFTSGSLKRKTPDRGPKDIVFTGLVADGRQAPFFVVEDNPGFTTQMLQDPGGQVVYLESSRKKSKRCVRFCFSILIDLICASGLRYKLVYLMYRFILPWSSFLI